MKKFVLLIYQGSAPLPGSDRWKALPEAGQKAIYADYAAINQTADKMPARRLNRSSHPGRLQGHYCR